MFRYVLCSATLAVLATFAAPLSGAGRQVIALDGTWQIAEGPMAAAPKAFDHKAPVPGLADMAVPAFASVGCPDWQKQDPRREAFWYRRTFAIEGVVPAFATLKIRQAC